MKEATIDSAEASKCQAEERARSMRTSSPTPRQEAAKLVADAQNRPAGLKGQNGGRRGPTPSGAGRRGADRLERDAMLRGARNEVASLALLAAAKVAQRPTEDGDRALVDSFLAEVGEQA